LKAVLQIVPRQPVAVVLHDSFMPSCREGMRRAEWRSSPHVHYVELDLVPGCVLPNSSSIDGIMAGGLGFALLKPEHRSGDLEVSSPRFRNLTLSTGTQNLRSLQLGHL